MAESRREPARSRLAGAATALAAFVVAFLGTGCAPSEEGGEAPAASGAASGGPPWFEEAAAERGLVFAHASGQGERYLYPEIIGGGGALFDMDADGDLDAYLVQSGRVVDARDERPPNRLFANRGDGRFDDVTDASGAGDRGYGMGVACGDYDDDGRVDLYVTNLERNALLHNQGGGRFVDATEAARADVPLWSTSAGFLDYDNDGDLDLFVVNYILWSLAVERTCYSQPFGETYCGPLAYNSPAPDALLRNEGDGTLTDVSDRAGLRAAIGNGLGLACSDFDGDGLVDVFVANDQHKDQLWMNQGDGRLADRAVALGCAVDLDGQIKAGMGVGIVDWDDDGDEELLVVNLAGEPDSFFVNEGTHFADRTAFVGLSAASRIYTRFGVGFADFDNDGLPDLYQANGRVSHDPEVDASDPFAEPNLLFRGDGRGRLREVLPRGGTSALLEATSRAAAFGDVDGDGGVDVLVVNRDGPAHLLMNVRSGEGRWVAFRVRTATGRDALGTRLAIRAGERTLRRTVRSAYSYCAASDPRVHVGLGELTRVDEVVVEWPDGAVETFGPFDAGAVWELERGRGR